MCHGRGKRESVKLRWLITGDVRNFRDCPSVNINWFIKKFSPSYLIHGHIHLYDANDQRITAVKNNSNNETLVINAFSHIILNLFAPPEEAIGESNV